MALRTPLDEATARPLFAAYGLELQSLEPLPAQGTVNSNFRVQAGGKRWFLRLNEGKGAADVAAEVALVDRLLAAGLPTPAIQRAKDGRAVLEAAGRPTTLFPWIEGREAAPDPTRPSTVAVVGRALGRLHRAGAGLGPDELPRNHYSLAELERRLGSFATDPRFADCAPLLAAELTAARARPSMISGLIHQDLFPDNLLVDEAGELVAVLDFEQATFGALVYDLAVVINAWCWTGQQIDQGAQAALLTAYEAERPLTAEERQRLPAEVRLAAARFAITRITDVFLPADVDPGLRQRKDYREYLARLAFWQAAG